MKLDDKTLMNLINGALRNCIIDHGPVTKQYVSSASKRIANAVEGHVCEMLKRDLRDKMEPSATVVDSKAYARLKRQHSKMLKTIKYWMNKARLEENQ